MQTAKASASTPIRLRDGRDDFNVVFIHSRLDEYGLSPAQFRVYAHIARRAGNGEAFPAIASVSRVCLLHPQTVRRALRVLVKHRLLRRDDRPGSTSLYRLTPACEWQPLTHISGTPSETDAPPSLSKGTPAQKMQPHPYEGDGAKVTPSEVHPNKAIHLPHSPPAGERVCALSNIVVGQDEEIYAAYPKKVGKPAALRAIRRAIKLHSFELVLERTHLYASTYTGEARFIPNPSTFFNQARFLDDPATWQRTSSAGGRVQPSRQFQPGDYNQPVTNF